MSLAQRVMAVVRLSSLADSPSKPAGAVAVPTNLFVRLLQGQINKYCAAFEHVVAETGPNFIPFERTKSMLMLLRMLRWSYSSQDIVREGCLSWDRKTIALKNGRLAHRQGMGLAHTMEMYEFGWMLPKLNVRDWMFTDKTWDKMLFANPAIEQVY